MIFNNSALKLAAVGIIGLASAVQAIETQINVLETALTSTTIGGYVDTSAQWNFYTGNANMPDYKFGGTTKADGFNLNVVQLTVERPMDESRWAAGYRADLWFGPDANTLGTQSILASGMSDFAVRQAYVALRMPIGNGINFKVGVFDNIFGYESLEAGKNANFTRSYGHSIEPQTYTGLVGSYRFNDVVALSAGIANTMGSTINDRAYASTAKVSGDMAESFKTYMGSLDLTFPQSFGLLGGSILQLGIANGFFATGPVSPTNGFTRTGWYVGIRIPTAMEKLKLGLCWDYREFRDSGLDYWALSGYASYQATTKLSLHGRLEYYNVGEDPNSGKVFGVTSTVQYDLWQNVLSRLELRWDYSANGFNRFGGDPTTTAPEPTTRRAVLVALNVIYKF